MPIRSKGDDGTIVVEKVSSEMNHSDFFHQSPLHRTLRAPPRRSDGAATSFCFSYLIALSRGSVDEFYSSI
jgi:hypothetical protein